MIIGKITSKPVPKYIEGKFQQGEYELPIKVNLAKARASGDPSGYAKHRIAQHLASCVEATELPLDESIWTVTIEPKAMEMFGLPARFVV